MTWFEKRIKILSINKITTFDLITRTEILLHALRSFASNRTNGQNFFLIIGYFHGGQTLSNNNKCIRTPACIYIEFMWLATHRSSWPLRLLVSLPGFIAIIFLLHSLQVQFVFILFGLTGILFHKFLIVIFSLNIHGTCFSQLNQDRNYSDSLQPPKTGKDSAADILELLKNILANLSNELEYIYIMSITVIKYMHFYFVSNST